MRFDMTSTYERRRWHRALPCLLAVSTLAACMTDQAAPVYQRSRAPGMSGPATPGAAQRTTATPGPVSPNPAPGNSAQSAVASPSSASPYPAGGATAPTPSGAGPTAQSGAMPTVPPGQPVFGRAEGDAAGSAAWAYRKSTPSGVKRPYVEGAASDAPQVGVIAAAPAIGTPAAPPAPAASSAVAPTAAGARDESDRAAASGPASAGATDATPGRGSGALDGVPFAWPARSALSQDFGQTGKRGVVFDGKAGDPVVAAADGDVIFSGAGPRGYGKLIIISHAKDLLSVYGHNRTLLVKEGQKVKRGQRIAELGDSGSDRPGLHFEIRKQGNAVDPLSVLSHR